MAYDRAERFSKLNTQTPADIGPGTYDISDSTWPTRNIDVVCPFLTGSKRKTVTVSKDAEQFPAPGTYDIKESRHIPESVSIDLTDSRFKEKIYEGPGPTEYDPPDCPFKLTSRKVRSHPGTWRGPAGKLWLIRPPRCITSTGLSIPSKHDSNGYDIDEQGNLIKNPPIQRKPTFFYDVPQGETNYTTLKYKGNFWSRMTGRQSTTSFLTPAPGNYDHEVQRPLSQIYFEKIREYKRSSSRQPRFLDTLYRKKFLENFPAPNTYRPQRLFENFTKTGNFDPYKLDPPPFGRTGERFEDKKHSDTPGPGAYEYRDREQCIVSVYGAPFGARAGRFRKAPDNTGPAPGDYHTNVGNLAFESTRRFQRRYERAPGTCPVRTIPSIEEENDGSHGWIEEINMIELRDVYHAAFKSTTERFPSIRKGVDVPDPGAYEALAAFKANRDRCDFLCRRLAPPFGTRGNRFPKIPEGIDIHVPVASRYDTRSDIAKNVKGGVISYPRRSSENEPEGPSPVHYTIHPYVSSSIVKKSFNVTLGRSKVIENLSNGEEKNSVSRLRSSQKALRCFAVPVRRHKNCLTTCG